jgi:excisionase family DNA binding protein
MQRLLTSEDVAEWLRVDVVTVRRLINRGELPAYRVGGEFRFKESDLEEFLERQRVPAAAGGGLGKLAGGTLRKLISLTGDGEGFGTLTERARKVLVRAQAEAQRLRHNFIGTEHLLLGLVEESDGVAAVVLRELGIEPERIQALVRERVTEGDGEPHGEMALTPRTKKVLQLAAQEAQELGHRYVGTEHMLLAIMREGEGVAARLLRDLGISFETLQARVVQVLTARP